MSAQTQKDETRAYTQFLADWLSGLPRLSFKAINPDPRQIGIVSVDIVNGFCYEGALASPRVKQIVAPTVRLFEHAWEYGIRDIALAQDTHDPDSLEFAQFPPHCLRGTTESEVVPEIKALPFFSKMQVFEKDSIHSGINTGLPAWIAGLPAVNTWIVVGDCTDLCTYQLAMYLRLEANARHLRQRRVIVPADCVDTYDMSVEVAKSVGAAPHPAELLHPLFLHHMALNGIEITAGID